MIRSSSHVAASAPTQDASPATPGHGGTGVQVGLEEILDGGLQLASSALTDAIQRRIRSDGPVYLDRAWEETQTAMRALVAWGKKNPMKSAAAATALAGITAFAVAFVQHRAAARAGR